MQSGVALRRYSDGVLGSVSKRLDDLRDVVCGEAHKLPDTNGSLDQKPGNADSDQCHQSQHDTGDGADGKPDDTAVEQKAHDGIDDNVGDHCSGRGNDRNGESKKQVVVWREQEQGGLIYVLVAMAPPKRDPQRFRR